MPAFARSASISPKLPRSVRKRPAAFAVGETGLGRGDRLRVLVDPDDERVRPERVEECRRVAAAAERAVHVHPGRVSDEPLDDLSVEDRRVVARRIRRGVVAIGGFGHRAGSGQGACAASHHLLGGVFVGAGLLSEVGVELGRVPDFEVVHRPDHHGRVRDAGEVAEVGGEEDAALGVERDVLGPHREGAEEVAGLLVLVLVERAEVGLLLLPHVERVEDDAGLEPPRSDERLLRLRLDGRGASWPGWPGGPSRQWRSRTGP
jgi:hypothetical protein